MHRPSVAMRRERRLAQPSKAPHRPESDNSLGRIQVIRTRAGQAALPRPAIFDRHRTIGRQTCSTKTPTRRTSLTTPCAGPWPRNCCAERGTEKHKRTTTASPHLAAGLYDAAELLLHGHAYSGPASHEQGFGHQRLASPAEPIAVLRGLRLRIPLVWCHRRRLGPAANPPRRAIPARPGGSRQHLRHPYRTTLGPAPAPGTGRRGGAGYQPFHSP
ncbi:hypothetical protein D9M69_455280 [compost metagenome]